ncbi:hypothetical protein [Aurantiacibacter luteus]|uniref:Uncharacterized protein n=1 Tax=Aurantiacibacter luteus TaxID=1581420 RepID=A0A0G9MVV2_9SPHN|nr:hypothetical protein [Aurantiacibacter luteus]KLE34689.1 hypothetical protein AAW00_11015 [Aurantiacibacter luteus]
MNDPSHIDYGALVGWTGSLSGERVTLRLQSVTRPPPHTEDDVHAHVYMLDTNQAAQLANYLLKMCDLSPPDRVNRGLLARLFG